MSWNGRCYFMPTSSVPDNFVKQPDAENVCRQAGASLATFTCREDWNVVFNKLPFTSGNYWILGGAASPSGCEWNYDHEPWLFAPWAPSQPAFGFGSCAYIAATTSGWVTVGCDARIGTPLCERP